MGAHRTDDEKTELGERARRLREQGWSRRRIEAELHVGGVLLTELLEGTTVPDALRRPRARDDARDLARQLRRQGWTYDQIARELGVAKSSCSLWLRDLPQPDPVPPPVMPAPDRPVLSASDRRNRARELRAAGALLREVADELGISANTAGKLCAGLPAPDRSRRATDHDRAVRAAEARWAPVRALRDARRAAVHAQASALLGPVSPRDLVVALAVSYWCEGSKAKPWNPQERLSWMNSDPGLVTLFLAGLRELGVSGEQITFRLSIHERADEGAARAWWSAHVGVDPAAFAPTTYKRHNPRTTRHNDEGSYRGCLRVDVRQSRELYQRLDGLVRTLVQACDAVPPEDESALGS